MIIWIEPFITGEERKPSYRDVVLYQLKQLENYITFCFFLKSAMKICTSHTKTNRNNILGLCLQNASLFEDVCPVGIHKLAFQ